MPVSIAACENGPQSLPACQGELMAAQNFDREEILRTLCVFRQPGEVLEMRIPKAGKFRTISGYFSEPVALVDSAVGLSAEGFAGIYFTINPVKSDLLARAANRYAKYAENTTSDADIIALDWLPIDLDAKRPAGISSTDEEHRAAISKAREVRQWLIDEMRWPADAFVLADSGNGAHLPARIGLPNTPESVALIKRCLAALDSRFSDKAVHVDKATYNPARIWKLYGTMARKGDSTSERPHRLARILDAPAELAAVTREQLEALAAIMPKAETSTGKTTSFGFDPKKYAEAHGAHVLRVDTWVDPEGGKWELAILDECPFDPSHNRGEARVGVREDGKRTFRCFHNSCQGRDWQALRALWGPERPKSEDAHENLLKGIDFEELTEGGNAARLERIHGDDLRYNHTHKKWYLWDNGRWKADGNGGAMRLAADVVGSLYLAASNADGKDARNELAGFAKETDTRKGLSNMLALAANRLKFALTADDFDKDAWLIGAENVTIDLKAGNLIKPRRKDLITKAIGARYDRAAKCPLWLKFLDRIFPDEELRRYIKRAAGYCLTGSMAEQIFFFCYGQGANGKSVFLAVLRALLGEYARQADFSTFLVQRNEKVRNDLAALAGARVITAIEAEEGGRLSMQIIKAWTGGDPVTTRYLFGEYFTFKPVGKIWLAANNKPAISERNHAAWRRVRLIPFLVTIPPEEQDNELENRLLEELPGILNWALEELKEYLGGGLKAPKAVLEATSEYRRENDSLEQFIFECCEMGNLKVCKNTELYGTYLSFCGMSGLNALSQHKFSPELKAREGISSTKSKHGVEWKGIALKDEWVTVLSGPSPIALGAKGDGLGQNAQSFENFSLRGDFAHKPSYPSPHNDSKPSPSQKETLSADVRGGEEDGQKVPKQDKNLNLDDPTRGAAQPRDSPEKGATSVKFNTDYRTDWIDPDGKPIMRQFQEGEIVEVSMDRAQAWAKRGVVAILEAPA
jgi:putative DNA primase/helicase